MASRSCRTKGMRFGHVLLAPVKRVSRKHAMCDRRRCHHTEPINIGASDFATHRSGRRNHYLRHT